MTPLKISPSLLGANPLCLEKEIAEVEAGGASLHHIDVMDGHFVPNLTFGLPLIRSLKSVSKLPLDVHIMVSNPDLVALDYVKAGADILVFHIEAAVHPHRLLQSIRSLGSKAGVAINPGTPVEVLTPIISELDVVNIMSVNPGFGGQKFLESSVSRVEAVAKIAKDAHCLDSVEIEVDGGIDATNIGRIVKAGASIIVAGSSVYGSSDRPAAIADLIRACE